MNRTFKLLMVLMTLTLFSTVAFGATTWYVDVEAATGGTGTSAKPFQTIGAAITALVGVGEIIEVKPGIYNEALLIDTPVTIKSSVKGEPVIVNGKNDATGTYAVAIAANDVTLIDIKLKESVAGGDDISALLVCDGFSGVQLVRCIFDTTNYNGSTGATYNTPKLAMKLKGDLYDWKIEYCTFTLHGHADIGVYISSTGAVDTNVGNDGASEKFNIVGNTFNGPVPDDSLAVAVKLDNIVGVIDSLQIAANIADKAGFELVTTKATVVKNVSILSNTIKRVNGLLIDVRNGGTALDTPVATDGKLNILYNHFGSSNTNGNKKWAIRMLVDDADIVQANVHINYNNFHYPMTGATPPETYAGHLNYAGGVGGGVGNLGVGTIDVKMNWWGSTAGPSAVFANGAAAVIMTTPYGKGAAAPGLLVSGDWIESHTKPVLNTPNKGGAVTVDWDGNGMIDRIEVYFDAGLEPLDPSSLANTGLAVDGYTLNTAIKPKVNIDNTGNGEVSGGNAMTIFLKESGSYDTGVTPEVTYSEGTLNGITGALAGKIATFTVEPSDEVVPLATAIKTYDTDSNGKLDKITVTFSETMFPYSSGEWQEIITFGDMEYPASTAYDASKASHSAGVVTFTLTEIDDDDTGATTVYYYDTGVKPDVVISDSDASQDVKDASGNPIVTEKTYISTDTIYKDLAAPVAVKVGTRDATQIVASADGDGYLDGIAITFSEAVEVAINEATTPAYDDFLDGLSVDMGTGENTIDLDVTAVTKLNNVAVTVDPSGTTIEIIGESGQERMYLDKSPWDTDATPTVTWDSTGDVEDAEGNEWVYFIGGLTSLVAVDQAKPVIVEAFGEVTTKKLHVSFSEAVVKAGVAEDVSTDLVITDFNYAGSTTGATSLASMSEGDASVVDADTEKFDVIILVNYNFIDGTDVKADGSKDAINAVAGAIEDVVGEDFVANTAVAEVIVGLIAWDVTAPTLGYTEMMDADGDGWIDHIRLTFSEKINDASLYGYDGAGVNINSDIAQYFTVAGYTVVGLNMLDDNSSDANGSKEAATTAAEANAAIADIFAKDQNGHVINILDEPNDNLLYLMVQEKSADATGEPGEGDTAAVPTMSIVSGEATGAKIRDRYTSYYTGGTDIQTLDLAAPAIMGARMLSETEAELWFSEDVSKTQNTLIATNIDVKSIAITAPATTIENGNDIVWHVGSAQQLWNGNIEGIDVIAKNNWKITVTDDGNVPAGTTGRIAIGTSQLTDGITRYLRDDDGDFTLDADDAKIKGYKDAWGASVTSSALRGFMNVQGVSGGSQSSANKTSTIDWVVVTPYTAPDEPVVTDPAISKSALQPVDATEAQINPSNVAAVKFYGAADANADVMVKLVDMNGNEVTAAATANSVGKFSGTVDATTLADGMVTMMAGAADAAGAVADWLSFADYLKDAAAIGAPTDLAVVDVPNDNGGYVYATFAVSANHFTMKTDFNVVESYVFYRDVLLPDAADANDTTCMPWVVIPGDVMPDADGMVTVLLPTKDNAEATWRVLASTGSANSDMAMKAAGVAVSAFSNAVTGSAVDNIAPAPFASFTSGATATKSGVQISWVAPTDVELKYQHGVVGSYTLVGQEVSIYGVDAYEIYRKTGTAEFAKIGTVGPGADSLSITFPTVRKSTSTM